MGDAYFPKPSGFIIGPNCTPHFGPHRQMMQCVRLALGIEWLSFMAEYELSSVPRPEGAGTNYLPGVVEIRFHGRALYTRNA